METGILHLKLLSLESADSAGKVYRLMIKYMDSLLLLCDMVAMESFPLQGRTYCYDQAEYPFDVRNIQQVRSMVNRPLVVTIEPTTATSAAASNIGSISSVASSKPSDSRKLSGAGALSTMSSSFTDISFCNIDMLPVICGENKVKIRKRLEPVVQPNILLRKSWCNLPLVTLELYVERSQPSLHKDLMSAKSVELTVLASYNMPCEDAAMSTFTLASQLPVMDAQEYGTFTFIGDAYKVRNMEDRLDWESIRQDSVENSTSDKKFSLKRSEIINADKLDLNKYLKTDTPSLVTAGTVGWYSWQRSLVKCDGGTGTLQTRIRDFKWPVEVRGHGDLSYLHFFTFIDLFPLLFPGERSVVAAAKFYWYQPEAFVEYCGCSSLLPPEPPPKNKTKATTKHISADVLRVESSALVPVSNANEDPAFILIELTLSSPLLEACIPPQITDAKLSELLSDMERTASRRHNTGRGHADNFKECIKDGVKLLRSLRTTGSSEACITSRQLGESKQLLALHTSLVHEAALYINDAFVLQQQYSDKEYEDLLLTAHALLLREASLVIDKVQNQPVPEQQTPLGPRIAARCSRQLRDNDQALRLFYECVALAPWDAGAWRELSTCLMDTSPGRARVCLKKSLLLDPRNPITLLSLGCITWKENIEAAEWFFLAILKMHPLWLPGWIAAHSYYKNVEKFLVADAVLEIVHGMPMKPNQEPFIPRAWAQELGDWWEPTPLLERYSPYLDTADLLLRLRAIDLAELCLAQHQIVHGESGPYVHLLGLCFFLRGEYSDALCHLLSHGGLKYMLSLTGECLLKMGNIPGARTAYMSAISAGASAADAVMHAAALHTNKLRARNMLQQLVRRCSCAQSWLSLAYNWIVGGEFEQAENCCIEALGEDRRSGIAWTVLMRLLARRGRRVRAKFCQSMADYCGHVTPDCYLDCITSSAEQIDVLVSEKLRECVCPDDVEDDITSHVNVY